VGSAYSKLLWQNASPTSHFANQTITLPSNNFPFFRVLFGDAFGSICADITFPAGNPAHASLNSGTDGYAAGSGILANRVVTGSTQTSVTFSACHYMNVNAGSWSGFNGLLMPLYIFGVGGLD
jgi:hypothetical protein